MCSRVPLIGHQAAGTLVVGQDQVIGPSGGIKPLDTLVVGRDQAIGTGTDSELGLEGGSTEQFR